MKGVPDAREPSVGSAMDQFDMLTFLATEMNGLNRARYLQSDRKGWTSESATVDLR
jgi:hypothetical protein